MARLGGVDRPAGQGASTGQVLLGETKPLAVRSNDLSIQDHAGAVRWLAVVRIHDATPGVISPFSDRKRAEPKPPSRRTPRSSIHGDRRRRNRKLEHEVFFRGGLTSSAMPV